MASGRFVVRHAVVKGAKCVDGDGGPRSYEEVAFPCKECDYRLRAKFRSMSVVLFSREPNKKHYVISFWDVVKC